MSVSLYRSVVGLPSRALDSLSSIVKKAESQPNAEALLSATLFEGMLPFSWQIYNVCDVASRGLARASNVEPPKMEKTPTYADMHARIAEVQEMLKKADESTINGRAAEEVTIGLGPGKMGKVLTADYIPGYTLPNLFFHISMAYAILRKEGVDIGKMDYLDSYLTPYLITGA